MNSPQIAQSSFMDMVLAAGPVGKFVLLLLLVASILSWSIILTKWRTLKAALAQNSDFLTAFWNAKSMEEVFIRSDQYDASPVAQVFRAGIKELKKHTDEPELESVARALARQTNTEVAELEKSVSWLATTASAAPFVGLFGTVWGIMDSFHRIGMTGSANLAIVAPGISEALIATAVGIGVAIPAVIAYNHFSGLIRRQANDMECFHQDLLNIIQRNLAGRKRPPALS